MVQQIEFYQIINLLFYLWSDIGIQKVLFLMWPLK